MTLEEWLEGKQSTSGNSPEWQTRVDIALGFLKSHYQYDGQILNEIKCIDFSKEVSTPTVARDTMLVGFKDPRISPYRSKYFTKSGYSVQSLGISPYGRPSFKDRKTGASWTAGSVMEKVMHRYEVLVSIPPTEVLMSSCAPAADNWSLEGKTILAAGGGLQYLIPNANRFLRYIEPQRKY